MVVFTAHVIQGIKPQLCRCQICVISFKSHPWLTDAPYNYNYNHNYMIRKVLCKIKNKISRARVHILHAGIWGLIPGTAWSLNTAMHRPGGPMHCHLCLSPK